MSKPKRRKLEGTTLIVNSEIYCQAPQPATRDQSKSTEKAIEVKKKLIKRAKSIYGTATTGAVTLQLQVERDVSEENFGLDDFGCQENKESMVLNCIFQTAKAKAEKYVNEQNWNEEARKRFVKKRGKTVGIVGIAGIGKSTLGMQFMELCVINFEGTKNPGFVFHVILSRLNEEQPISVLQFLVKTNCCDIKLTIEEEQDLLEHISNSEDVFIIMDSMDEAKFPDLDTEAESMTKEEQFPPGVIFRNLLSGNILPKSHKMVISRLGAYHRLHSAHKPLLSVKVNGLSTESQGKLFRGMSPDNHQKITDSLKLYPAAKAICFVPKFAQLVGPYALDQGSKKVYSLADIYTHYVVNNVTKLKRGKRKDFIQGVAKLAFEAFSENRFFLNVLELNQLETNHPLDLFITFQEEGKPYFNHRTWQEYFSALHLVFFLPLEGFKACLQNAIKTMWGVVLRFVNGLVNPTVQRNLEKLCLTLDSYKEKVSCIVNFSVSLAGEYARTGVHTFPLKMEEMGLACAQVKWNAFQKCPHDNRHFKACNLTYESKSDEQATEVLNALPDNVLITGRVNPIEVASLSHVLKAQPDVERHRSIKLHIGAFMAPAEFSEDGLVSLLKKVQASRHQIKKLHVTNELMTDESLGQIKAIVNSLEELSLQSCRSGSERLNAVFEKLRDRPTAIAMLDLSLNAMDDQLTLAVSNSLKKLQRLELHSCKITTKQLKELATGIEKLICPIKLLNLGGNKFGNEGLTCLIGCLHKIEVLKVNNCNIQGSGLGEFSTALSKLPKPMAWLGLAHNDIGFEGMKHLSNCLDKIESLWIYQSNLEENGVEVFAKRLQSLDYLVMKRFSLGGNNIGSKGMKNLAKCLRQIEILDLDFCNLTDDDIKVLVQELKKLTLPLKMLNLSRNAVNERSSKALSEAIYYVERLWLDGCDIGSGALEPLTEAIATMDANGPALEALNLNYNRFGNEGCKLLEQCLHNINLLGIAGCGVTADCLSSFPSMKYPRVITGMQERSVFDKKNLHNVPLWDVSSFGSSGSHAEVQAVVHEEQASTSGLS